MIVVPAVIPRQLCCEEPLLKLKSGQKILDMPCGYGRHSNGLAQKGMQVTGVDLNQKELSYAKQSVGSANMPEFVHSDMRLFKRPESFDAAVNMFYSFGFFESDGENMQVLQNFYGSLKPGGKFLMHTDVNILRVLSGKYKEHEVRNLSGGGRLEIVDQYDSQSKRINGLWRIKKSGVAGIERPYSVRVYTKEEFESMCRSAGFATVSAYGDWNGSNYSEDSENMIIIAKK